MDNATPEEWIGEPSLGIRSYYDDWSEIGRAFYILIRFTNQKFHLIKLKQQVIRKIARRLVDLIYQDDERFVRLCSVPTEGIAERAGSEKAALRNLPLLLPCSPKLRFSIP